MRRNNYPKLAFIEAWQQARNLDDFVSKTGMNEHTAVQRAWRYRKDGIPLKTMSRRPSLAELIKFAQSFIEPSDNGKPG